MRLPDLSRLDSSLSRLPLGFLAAVGIGVGLFWVYARYHQKPVAPLPREKTELPAALPREPGKYVRILAIDNGGMRSLLALHCLDYLEKRSGKPACELFDIMVGTGSGSFVVAALTAPRADRAPRFTASDLVERFPKHWAASRDTPLLHPLLSMDGRLSPRYLTRQRQAVMQEFFGDAKLGEALTTIILPAYSVSDQVPFLFASDMGKSTTLAGGNTRAITEAGDYFLADAVCAATGDPATFAPLQTVDFSGEQKVLMTGGDTYAANPALLALGEALLRFPGRQAVVISLGAGIPPVPAPLPPATGWSRTGSAEDIQRSAEASSRFLDAQLLSTLHRFGAGPVAAYVRLDPQLPDGVPSPDDVSPKAVGEFNTLGKKLTADKKATLDRTADFLGADLDAIR